MRVERNEQSTTVTELSYPLIRCDMAGEGGQLSYYDSGLFGFPAHCSGCTDWDQMTKFTFTQAGEIPGRVLPAGMYWDCCCKKSAR